MMERLTMERGRSAGRQSLAMVSTILVSDAWEIDNPIRRRGGSRRAKEGRERPFDESFESS
jgi:hypothetical protein